MKLVGIITIIYTLIGIFNGPWGRILSDGELAFCVMLIVIDMILLTDGGGEVDG